MTRTLYADALGRLAREQHQVVTTGQLAVIGVPAHAVRNLCRPGGRWQRVLPRVIVLGTGALTAEQRCRAALAYAGHPQAGPDEPWQQAGGALLTGAAALALHGLAAASPAGAGGPVVDVLVPRDRGVRTHTWVRVHTVPVLPRAQLAGGLPVVPVARAAVDAVRACGDPLWVRSVLTEAVTGRGAGVAALADELQAEGLTGRPGVAETLRDLRAGSRGPAAEQPRAPAPGSGAPTPP